MFTIGNVLYVMRYDKAAKGYAKRHAIFEIARDTRRQRSSRATSFRKEITNINLTLATHFLPQRDNRLLHICAPYDLT